jgi:hypothetical protein
MDVRICNSRILTLVAGVPVAYCRTPNCGREFV